MRGRSSLSMQPWERDQCIPANGGQVQERSKEARPNQQARQTHGRCIQGVKVDCYNIMVMQRRKERKSERPFEVLHGPTISSGKYEHSPRVGVAVLFSEGRRST